MLDQFTTATFKPHVGSRFEITPGEGSPFEAVLSNCKETPFGAPGEWERTGRRVPFSLLFHADREVLVPQQICALRHAELGNFELFLVPLGPDENGMRYEAVLS